MPIAGDQVFFTQHIVGHQAGSGGDQARTGAVGKRDGGATALPVDHRDMGGALCGGFLACDLFAVDLRKIGGEQSG